MVDTERRNRILCFAAICGFVALGWGLIALLSPMGPYSRFEEFVVGLLLGTMLGQVSLSAAWCALGPFALVRRLPLSVAWIAVLLLAVGFNIRRGPAPDSGILVIMAIVGGALFGQWLLVQIPLWLLIAVYGLRIQTEQEQSDSAGGRDKQFGIRQLMIITAIVALLLGSGRLLFGQMTWDASRDQWEGVIIWVVWAVASALVAFPLIAAALLRRWTFLGTGIAIGLVAGITLIEAQIFSWVSGPPISANGLSFWMNGFQCLWILVPILALRATGYRLMSRTTATTTSAPTSASSIEPSDS